MKKQALVHWILPAFLLLAFYFLTRFVAIRALPPFNDEFIYVRWAQEGFFDAGKRLVSLTDGKQPLFVWLTSLMMNLIPSPLAAGRIVSILAGAAAMVGVGIFSYQLFKSRVVSFFTAFLYVISPLTLLLDRFALYDSLLAALSVWSMVVTYWLVTQPSLGAALVLALLLGAALLTKSSAFLIILVLPLFVVFFAKKRAASIASIAYVGLAVILGYLYQSVQYLSESAAFVAEKNKQFVYTLQELIGGKALEAITHNLPLFSGWIIFYFSLLLIAVVAAWVLNRAQRRTYLFLSLMFLVPFLIVVLTGKIVFPRHLLFLTLPLFILAASGLTKIRSRLLAFLCIVPLLWMSGSMLVDFASAPMAAVDRFQYVEGWPAGWGVKEIVQYVEPESQKGSLTILTEGTFGSLPTTAMQLYFGNFPQVHIVPVDGVTFEISQYVNWDEPVYAILNIAQAPPPHWDTEEVVKVQKGNGESFIRLLRVSSVD